MKILKKHIAKEIKANHPSYDILTINNIISDAFDIIQSHVMDGDDVLITKFGKFRKHTSRIGKYNIHHSIDRNYKKQAGGNASIRFTQSWNEKKKARSKK